MVIVFTASQEVGLRQIRGTRRCSCSAARHPNPRQMRETPHSTPFRGLLSVASQPLPTHAKPV